MAKTAKIEVKDGDLVATLQGFCKLLLEKGGVDAVLVPQHLPMKATVMPTLVSDPEKLEGCDPLAPAFPLNASKVVSRLTRKSTGRNVAAILRPCEIRAFIELVKLKQGNTEEVVLIGTDCYGAYSNTDYGRFAGEDGIESTKVFYKSMISGQGAPPGDFDLSPACKACEYPVADSADIVIGIFGMNPDDHLLLKANTPKGEAVLAGLGLPGIQEPEGRKGAIEALVSERISYRDEMFQETAEATNDIEKLTTYLANCVNCYNCRVACPVCYCKECVFVTDVFDHEPIQYFRWAKRKGMIKMPTDTVFYHITRLAHMSTACIGCGQCSNACPNDIPVMEIFRTIASYTQKAFDYVPGRSIEEEPPLTVFREAEFSEVTGGKD